jgi:hypothetical protein
MTLDLFEVPLTGATANFTTTRNSMNHAFQIGNLGPAGRKALYLLFARPERPRNGPSLISAGGPYSSRGQSPRKMRPPQGPTLKGSNTGDLAPILRSAVLELEKPQISKTGVSPRIRKHQSKEKPQTAKTAVCATLASQRVSYHRETNVF